MDGALAEFFDLAILDFLRDTEEELSSSEFRKTSETELKYLKDLNSNSNIYHQLHPDLASTL